MRFLKTYLLLPLLVVSLLLGGGCTPAAYSEYAYEDFAESFTGAFLNNDVSAASKLKTAFPRYYDELLVKLQSRINSEELSVQEKTTAAGLFAWAVMIR